MKPFVFPILVGMWVGLGLDFSPCGLWPGAEASSGERNPFAFPAGIPSPKGPAGGGISASGVPGTEAAPTFRVTTILIGDRTKVAAVNGRLVREGEEVEGFRLVEILPGQVTLRRGKEKRIVKLDYDRSMLLKPSDSLQRVMGPGK